MSKNIFSSSILMSTGATTSIAGLILLWIISADIYAIQILVVTCVVWAYSFNQLLLQQKKLLTDTKTQHQKDLADKASFSILTEELNQGSQQELDYIDSDLREYRIFRPVRFQALSKASMV